MSEKPNLQQEKAIYSSASSLLLSAGAGSGKTKVIKNRVAYLAHDLNVPLSKMLVLTFTNKAASEMKTRIRDVFMEMSKKEKGEAKEKYLRLASEVDSAAITTFDSFALSFVKEYRTELGLAPNIQIGDDTILSLEVHARLDSLLEDAYQKLIVHLREKDFDKEKDPLYCFLKTFTHKNDEPLKEAILSLLDRANDHENPLEYLQQFPHIYSDNDFIRKELIELIRRRLHSVEKALEMISLYDRDEGNILLAAEDTKQVESLKGVLLHALSSKDKEVLLGALEANISFPVAKNDYALPKDTDASVWRSEVKALCASSFEDWLKFGVEKEGGNVTLSSLLNEDTQRLEEISTLLCSFAIPLYLQMDEYKKKQGIFTFSDIFHLALEALEKDRVKKDFQTRYEHILVDECQDNNDLQYALIDKIHALNPSSHLFMVGDVKQSIYRFRKANPKLFQAREKCYQENQNSGDTSFEVIHMNTNYRSDAPIIDGVNHLFGNLMSEECGGVDYDEKQNMETGKLTSLPSSGFFSLLIPKRPKFGEGEKEDFALSNAERRAKYLAGEIACRISEGASPGDFAILVRTKTNFLLYAKALSNYHLPVVLVNETELNSENLVMTLISLFKLVHHFYELKKTDEEKSDKLLALMRHPFSSIYRSFLFVEETGKKEEGQSEGNLLTLFQTGEWLNHSICQKTKNLADIYGDKSPVEGLEALIEEFSLIAHLPYLGNLKACYRQLGTIRDYAKTVEGLGKKFADFCSLLETGVNEFTLTLPAEPSAEDNGVIFPNKDSNTLTSPIRIMTIHASKGLQFPYVYLPELSWKKLQRDSSALSRDYGLILKNSSYAIQKKVGQGFKQVSLSPLGALLSSSSEKEEAVSELVRLFYVAITRAEKQCVFVFDEKKENAPILHRFGSYYSSQEEGEDGKIKFSLHSILSFEDMLRYASYGKFQLPAPSLARLGREYQAKGNTYQYSLEEGKTLHVSFQSKKKEEIKRPSKELGERIDDKTLLYGTFLHRAFEISDLKNGIPNSLLSEKVKKTLQNAFNSPLMQKVRTAKAIMKEYSYMDEEGRKGQIDLLVFFEEEAYIIDYKTSSLHDSAYEEQLATYQAYIRNTFPELKSVRCFLLSILHPEQTKEVCLSS